MANSSTGSYIYLCHFCSDEFTNRTLLTAHFLQCQTHKISKPETVKVLSPPPKLNEAQLNILSMVKLQPSKKTSTSNDLNPTKRNDLNLDIPLASLYSKGCLPSSSNQSSFDDSTCNLNDIDLSIIKTEDNEEQSNGNLLNNKIMSCHTYKYSRRERELFYTRIKRSLLKKNVNLKSPNKFRSKDNLPAIFNQTNYLINIPTKINSRQRINSNSNYIYPLLFSPNFNTLVQLPTNALLKNYLFNIKIYFHLIHSIASQEFQTIVHNYDNQHQFTFTSLSIINILRKAIYDYTANVQTSFKRTYYQTFHSENDDDHNNNNNNDEDNNEHESAINHDTEFSIPPLKIRRYDDSYEIEKRSISSTTTSSSSGMSIVQINNGHSQYDDRRRFDARPKKCPVKTSDNQINSNSNDSERRDPSDLIVGSPLQCDLSVNDHQQLQDGLNNESYLCSSLSNSSEQKSKKNPSPILTREQTNDSLPKYQSVVLNDGARIRIVNCSNDNNNKQLSSRSNSSSSLTKKLSLSIDKIDENCTTKSTRINTRKVSLTNSKTPDISEVSPTYQAQSVLLSSSEISNQWATHNVFYRCHVCSHEEFFVVLSRECIRLHVSSKHGNMEENFKQRISNFLNNQGRALKIFQHYLKWQQPWSEKEIDQIFQLSNVTHRTNGAI